LNSVGNKICISQKLKTCVRVDVMFGNDKKEKDGGEAHVCIYELHPFLLSLSWCVNNLLIIKMILCILYNYM